MKRFLHDQSGNVFMMFGLGAFMLMAALSVGIETARYSVAKTKMQFALDLAVLSAASVRESQDIHEVGNEFFELNYPSAFMNTVYDTTGTGGPVIMNWDNTNRVLSGRVRGRMKTYLGAFVGMDRLTIDNYAEVIEGTESRTTEIVLVVDNSASMCQLSSLFGSGGLDPSCAKLNAVKNATRNFIDIIYSQPSEGVHIGVVPFNHNVRMPSRPGLAAPSANAIWINNGFPPHLSCISPAPLQQVRTQINNPTAVKNYISNMATAPKAWAFTRTNVGTLIGGLMLMPYAVDRQHFNHQSGLPAEFNEKADKIMVILTDGENIPHYTGRPSQKIPVVATADNNHQGSVCTSLKNNYGITIYTVTYDLPGSVASNSIKRIFHDCATGSESYDGSVATQTPYYFDAQSNADLNLAYEVIAESINSVRLYK